MEKRATWIWYPGDFEVWLGNKFNNRRTERGAMFPPFWKQDSHWPTVVFTRDIDLAQPETVAIAVEGQFNLSIDGKLQAVEHANGTGASLPCGGSNFTIPAGRHKVALKVWNQCTPPAIFIDGPTVKTDSSWLVTYEDKIWIDENGVAHGSGIHVPVGHASKRADGCETTTLGGVAHDVCAAATLGGVAYYETPPSQFRLPTKPLRPVCCETVADNAALYDFGREVFGFLRFHGFHGEGTLRIYYGESREEALDTDHCETLDILHEGETLDSKAFRFVMVVKEGGAGYDDVTMDFEYAPFDPKSSGTFCCNDDELNKIWEVSARTLDLTTREFFCDGIKRDRWVWSGDAIQSYLMNYYLRFDTECVKRTIRQLRGKDPVTAHVNTIMDYTFYWFVSVWQYYQYTADTSFLRELWPRMVSLMDFVMNRFVNKNLAEGMEGDWVFVDWADFPMRKSGILAFEQILYWKALKVLEDCGRLLGHDSEADEYAKTAMAVKYATDLTLYSFKYDAYVHALEVIDDYGDGCRRFREDPQLTRFPNMFAIIYDFCLDETKQKLLHGVLLNPAVPPITTPYMRFYELEALCLMGQHDHVLQQMKSYWGGMLREGATSFWEKYNPEEKGTEHLAMYGRPYGKSLCHAWGASPLYIIGRYFLGVHPVKPGYEEYEVRPVLGGLEWMEGDVPTPFGKIHVKMDMKSVTVHSDGGQGKLIIGEKSIDIPANETIELFVGSERVVKGE